MQRRGWRWLAGAGAVAFAASCLLGLVVLAESLWVKPTGPNVLLVSVDTLRADHLGFYGYARDTSPNLDAFAKQSQVYLHCSAHGAMTGPSTASLLTGFLPHETTVFDNSPLPPSMVTAAEFLRDSGYRTRGIVSNFVLRKKEGYAQGFEAFDDEMDAVELVRGIAERTAGNATDRAMRALEELRGDPFFLWIHYQDPHGPYTPPERLASLFEAAEPGDELPINDSVSGNGGIPAYQVIGDERHPADYVSRYDREIFFVDEQFGRLIEELKRLDLLDRTVTIFTADHGEAMGEHAYWFAHGEHLYDGLLRVPLLMRIPGLAPAEHEHPVQHLDIVPTLLEISGRAPVAQLTGRSLLTTPEESRFIVSELDRSAQAVQSGGLKLVYGADEQVSLFDVLSDPAETVDLADRAAFAAERERLLGEARRVRELVLGGERSHAELSESEKEKLRALGYVE
jgi:arylsulfatase